MKKANSLIFKKCIYFLPVIVLIFTQTACIPFIKAIRSSENSQSSQPFSNQTHNKVLAAQFDLKSTSEVVAKDIYQLFMAKDFNAIEKIADEARSKKERLTGGYWKLDSIYIALSDIYAEYPNQEVTDEMWKNRIKMLVQWKEDSPESITARVALAESYIAYGWFARGTGYMNTVSQENRVLLQQRLDAAENELLDAAKLKTKCPRWYRTMLFLGMATGWSSDEFNQLFEEAINFEPNYLQFYLVKSENLTPKWNGSVENWATFINELPSQLSTLKTDEADIIYFTVVVNKLKDTSIQFNYGALSRDRMKKGFADMEKKYGVDNLRLNQYASYTILVRDFPAANAVFKRIGNDWNPEVWSNERFFNQMKQYSAQNEAIASK